MFHSAVLVKKIEQKGMTFDHEFCNLLSFSASLFFKGGERKGENNNQSRGQSHAFLIDICKNIELFYNY